MDEIKLKKEELDGLLEEAVQKTMKEKYELKKEERLKKSKSYKKRSLIKSLISIAILILCFPYISDSLFKEVISGIDMIIAGLENANDGLKEFQIYVRHIEIKIPFYNE